MTTSQIDNIALYEEIDFFRPLLKSTRGILDRYMRKQGMHIKENLDCFFVPSKGRHIPWEKVRNFEEDWKDFRAHYMGKKSICFYYEPPMQGLLNKDATFWIFSTIKNFENLCYRERLKINQFTPQEVKKIPLQNMERYFQQQISDKIYDEKKLYSIRAQECEKYLKLANVYLEKKISVELHHLARIMLKIEFHHEIESLLHILSGKVLVDASTLKTRLRAMHSLSLKYYFFNAKEEEKKKIDALIGRDKGSKLQALKYIDKLVSRSFNIGLETKRIKKIQKSFKEKEQ